VSQDRGGDDRFMRYITAMAALGQASSGGAESQIHTQEPISIKIRFTLQMLHGVGVFIAVLGTVGGLYLFTLGIDWLLRLGWDPRFYLIAWVLFLAAVASASALVQHVMRRLKLDVVPVVQAFAVVGLLLFVGLAVSSLLVTTRERFGWQLVGMVSGGALLLACPAIGYNQMMDLLNPYWRRSPYEQAVTRYLLPPLAEFLSSTDIERPGEVRTEDPRLLQRNGSQYGVVARPVAIQDPSIEDWGEFEDEDEELVAINAEAGNLIWFVRYASRMLSLSIDDLTTKPAPMLPFPETGSDGKPKYRRLRKDMIRRLIARGSTEDEFMVDGHSERGMGARGFWNLKGQGVKPEWAMERTDAQKKALEMWRVVYGDELPVPDYHQDLAEAA